MPSGVQAGNSYVRLAQIDSETPTDTSQADAVCDPFGESDAAGTQFGLKSKLWYLQPDQTHYESVRDYMANGTLLPADLYFNQLNVPTRAFNLGFVTQNGETLLTPNGDTLYEWFALRFESRVKLGDGDEPGLYQFAAVSDDGSIVDVSTDERGMRELISSPGLQSTKMSCAEEAIAFDASTKMPIQVDYYQGPRDHIALLMLWRKVPSTDAASLAEVGCGQMGIAKFFDANFTPARPSDLWIGMLDRGWKVLKPDNYLLPETTGGNPCEGDCFTDRFTAPRWSTFTLSKPNVTGSTVRVTVDGVATPATYDRALGVVYVPSMPAGAQDVRIGFCTGEPDPTPSPSPTCTVIGECTGGGVGV
jgi:hypothetical protein